MQLPIIAHISGSAESRSTDSVQSTECRREEKAGKEGRKAHRTEALRDRKKDTAGSAELRKEECM